MVEPSAAFAGEVSVVCVGTEREVGALASSLRGFLNVSIRGADACLADPDPRAVHIFFNEFRHDLRDCARGLVRRGIPTIYAIDGILEWRNSWEYPEGGSSLFAMRPVISHKVACIGRSQARVLAAWGNAAKCELVGMPRLDALAGRMRLRPAADAPVRVLVATATNPGFDAAQKETTRRSLRDLDAWARAHTAIGGRQIEFVWRLTGGLEREINPFGRHSSPAEEKLADVLEQIHAVITTPSTIQLEAMLLGHPVALLDYHNRPQYVPAAWVVSCREHLDQVIPDLLAPPESRLMHQDYLLHDALECWTPAAPRLARLVELVHAGATAARESGAVLKYPPLLLESGRETTGRELEMFDLFPNQAGFANHDIALLQAELEDCAAQLRLEQSRCKMQQLRCRQLEQEVERQRMIRRLLTWFPGPRKLARWYRSWRSDSGASAPSPGEKSP